jgi:hypothetical protein
MVFLMLTNQAGLYMKNGARLIDCFWHEKRKCLCFVFNRKETSELYELWDKHQLA